MTEAALEAPPAFERQGERAAWARWLGRLIDRLLMVPFVFAVFIVTGALVEFGRLPPEFIAFADNPIQATIAEIVVALVLWLLWEPLFLSNTGTTPGKWIMGVRVLRPDGSKIGFFTAMGRFLWVYAVGMGLGIPLLSLMCMFFANVTLAGEGKTAWDKGLGIEVTHTKRHPIVWLLAFIFVFGANTTLVILTRMAAE
ncbi:MAG: RDD family protein [Hyphomonadaceae bacterium]|nr:RDD family protein [Hyphomonadaceae bacterium]